MQTLLKEIRRAVTNIELEAGVKHPEHPDYALMAREAEKVSSLINRVKAEIGELQG